MQHIQGISRHQLQVVSLEDTISQDNPVRFIEAFAYSIHLERIDYREGGNTRKTNENLLQKKEAHLPLVILSQNFTKTP
jgi:hypothetical protein